MSTINRGRGLGSIFLRGDTYYLRYQTNGERKTISLNCQDEETAKKNASEILPASLATAESRTVVAAHIADAKQLIKTETHKVKLSEVWVEYKSSPIRPQSAEGTLGNYKRCWTWFENWQKIRYPAMKWMSEITPEIAQDYVKEKLLGKAMSASTFNYHIGALKLIFRILANAAALEENPFEKIERKAGVKQKRKEFTLKEVQGMLEAFNHLSDYPDRKPLHLINADEIRVLFYLLAYSGLRLVDACLLEWKSMSKGMLNVSPRKTRNVAASREVHIPICSELASQLQLAEEWKEEQGYVLPKTASRYLKNPDGVSDDCIRVIEWNEFKERNRKENANNAESEAKRGRNRRLYGVHSFRHFFASHCASKGVPIAVLAEILGDNITTLQRYYIHAGDAARKQVLEALPSSKPQLLPEKTSEKEKLQRIADVVSKAKPSAHLKAILAILQS